MNQEKLPKKESEFINNVFYVCLEHQEIDCKKCSSKSNLMNQNKECGDKIYEENN